METSERKPLNQIVLHIRRYAQHGEEHVLKNNGGYTVLVRKNPERNNSYDLSVARCGKSDNFSKKVGRAIAEGRLRCHRGVHYVAGVPFVSAVEAVQHMVERCHAEVDFDPDFIQRLIAKL